MNSQSTRLNLAPIVFRFTAQPAGKAGQSEKESMLAGRVEDLRRALQSLEETRSKIRESGLESSRDSRRRRVAMLKERLEMLKKMIANASPKQARALAKELKSIAGQLADAAKGAGGASSNGVALNLNVEAGGEATAEASTAAGETAAEPDAESAAAAAAGESEAVAAARPERGDANGDAAKPGEEGKGDDESLRELLRQAKRLLKEALSALKAKLAAAQQGGQAKAPGFDEMRADLRQVEKSLAKLDQAMVEPAGFNLYSAVGDLTATIGDAVGGAAGGVEVDIHV